MNEEIKIGASGFAAFVTSEPNSRTRILRPFKFRNKGEGAGRSSYYRAAITAIRNYHVSGNNQEILSAARQELSAQAAAAQEQRDRTRFKLNSLALAAYEELYGDRHFKILCNHRLRYRLSGLTITAQPDLWVEENSQQILIKLGISKKKPQMVDILLYLIRKAAISSGYRIRARNVVYLDITNGTERSCDMNLSRFNRSFAAAAGQISHMWPQIHAGATA